ncbi:hypothetical protein PUN47_20800 [Vibrio fluvialis]|uniref:hypothetical protein n=1 Tax=Vibrio fluvialis TaxID=676 RepID=UPI0023809326|nr:hypothetical protein [Vibrio fluvialis]WDY54291.1 hypothetical protein PUN47_20800 [Vibrio fluvialis]
MAISASTADFSIAVGGSNVADVYEIPAVALFTLDQMAGNRGFVVSGQDQEQIVILPGGYRIAPYMIEEELNNAENIGRLYTYTLEHVIKMRELSISDKSYTVTTGKWWRKRTTELSGFQLLGLLCDHPEGVSALVSRVGTVLEGAELVMHTAQGVITVHATSELPEKPMITVTLHYDDNDRISYSSRIAANVQDLVKRQVALYGKPVSKDIARSLA